MKTENLKKGVNRRDFLKSMGKAASLAITGSLMFIM
jgi:hypothetical protein